MVRLLHLSDIHFKGHEYPWDEDEDQRRELILDVERLVDRGGPVDGILVGGDIAFSGKPKEYEHAAAWIGNLVRAARCPDGCVWMVPGNHDVDLNVADESLIIRSFYEALRSCDSVDVSTRLRERLYEDPVSDVLVKHLDQYSSFAQARGCGTSAHRPHWSDSLELGGVPLLLWGVNSVLISNRSDAGGEKDAPNMVLGHQQTKVEREPGRISIVLCHHPPSWIRDWDLVAPFLDRAHVLLFGHEHKAFVEQSSDGAPVYVHAGAVGPEREGAWAPTYNLLSLNIESDRLRVVVESRVWNEEDTCFEQGPSPQVKYVDLEPQKSSESSQPSPPPEPQPSPPPEPQPSSDDAAMADGIQPAPATPVVSESADAEDMPAVRVRHLIFSYRNLPPTRRVEIAQALGVFDGIDLESRDPFGEILIRIGKSGLLTQLEGAMEE